MLSQLRPALVSLLLLTLITGVAYPLAVTSVAKVAFPEKAKGSVIVVNGKPVGSALIGQQFTDPKYFWSRPSATGPEPYTGEAGSGSNLAQTNPALLESVKLRVAALQAADPGNSLPIPIELVTASASGLDPEISPAAAEYQLARVARARGMSQDKLRKVVSQFTQDRSFGVLGEPRINVLQLNLALDAQ